VYLKQVHTCLYSNPDSHAVLWFVRKRRAKGFILSSTKWENWDTLAAVFFSKYCPMPGNVLCFGCWLNSVSNPIFFVCVSCCAILAVKAILHKLASDNLMCWISYTRPKGSFPESFVIFLFHKEDVDKSCLRFSLIWSVLSNHYMQKTKTKHKHNEHLNIKMRIASSGHLVWVDIWHAGNK